MIRIITIFTTLLFSFICVGWGQVINNKNDSITIAYNLNICKTMYAIELFDNLSIDGHMPVCCST